MRDRTFLATGVPLMFLLVASSTTAEDAPEDPLALCTGPHPTLVRAGPDPDAAVVARLEAGSCDVRLTERWIRDNRERLADEGEIWVPLTVAEGPQGWALVPREHLVRWAVRYEAKETQRAQLHAMVDGIRTAEIAYEAAFDTWVPVPEAVPRPVEALDRYAIHWPSGTAFDDLGWEPDTTVHGTFWVEADEHGFTVHGMCDMDEDGVPAHVTASRGHRSTRISAADVW